MGEIGSESREWTISDGEPEEIQNNSEFMIRGVGSRLIQAWGAAVRATGSAETAIVGGVEEATLAGTAGTAGGGGALARVSCDRGGAALDAALSAFGRVVTT